MPGTFLRSALLTGAADLVRELGGKPLTIARGVGLSRKALEDPDLLIPGRSAYAFLEHAAASCACPTLGLRLGHRANLAAVIGPLWVLLRHAQTLGQMCEDLAANFDVYTSVATMMVERTPRGLVLAWSSTAGQTDSEVQMAEYAIAVLVSEIRQHAPPRWQPGNVEFRHRAPRDLRLHHRILGPHLSFNRDRNAVFLETAVLDIPLDRGGSRTRALVGSVIRRNEHVMQRNVATQVETIVRALLPFAPCTVRDVSRAMNLPVRTLQHRLDGSPRSFKQIKDAVRADLALKYLRHSTLGLSEIAEILGYSELSAFSRSFRRWHGRSARSIRQESRCGADAVRRS